MDIDQDKFLARSRELSQPIYQQIMMCDDPTDLVLLASAMISFAAHILDQQYGTEATNAILKEISGRKRS